MIHSPKINGKQEVETFNLGIYEGKMSYEDILNSAVILRDEFIYDKKSGNPLITVWYIKEDESILNI